MSVKAYLKVPTGNSMRSLIQIDDLPDTEHTHELVGADRGDVPVSLILVDSAPGAGPALHRHW